MKTYNNLFPEIIFFDNIHLAYLKAKKNKKYKPDILSFFANLTHNLLEIKQEIEKETYVHGKYKEFIVNDSKKRKIRAPSFKDRVVHHALCIVIAPIFEKGFIYNSYACRNEKGSHKAIKKLRSYLKNKNNIYCFQCDISKYFDSVDHDILINIIKKKIWCQKTINLVLKIIDSFNKDTGIGIPIGNLTSQLFANIYLNELDQFVSRELKQGHYVRYMDDFLILGPNKKDLHRLRIVVEQFLKDKLKLKMNPKKVNIFPCSKGIDFLGYIVFKDYILLRKSTIKRFIKKIKKMKEGTVKKAWLAYAKHANSYSLSKKLFG
ncbi:MAG: reverse transcriptase/maturase family protein [Candidatus Paceibacterota bacterium]